MSINPYTIYSIPIASSAGMDLSDQEAVPERLASFEDEFGDFFEEEDKRKLHEAKVQKEMMALVSSKQMDLSDLNPLAKPTTFEEDFGDFFERRAFPPKSPQKAQGPDHSESSQNQDLDIPETEDTALQPLPDLKTASSKSKTARTLRKRAPKQKAEAESSSKTPQSTSKPRKFTKIKAGKEQRAVVQNPDALPDDDDEEMQQAKDPKGKGPKRLKKIAKVASNKIETKALPEEHVVKEPEDENSDSDFEKVPLISTSASKDYTAKNIVKMAHYRNELLTQYRKLRANLKKQEIDIPIIELKAKEKETTRGKKALEKDAIRERREAKYIAYAKLDEKYAKENCAFKYAPHTSPVLEFSNKRVVSKNKNSIYLENIAQFTSELNANIQILVKHFQVKKIDIPKIELPEKNYGEKPLLYTRRCKETEFIAYAKMDVEFATTNCNFKHAPYTAEALTYATETSRTLAEKQNGSIKKSENRAKPMLPRNQKRADHLEELTNNIELLKQEFKRQNKKLPAVDLTHVIKGESLSTTRSRLRATYLTYAEEISEFAKKHCTFLNLQNPLGEDEKTARILQYATPKSTEATKSALKTKFNGIAQFLNEAFEGSGAGAGSGSGAESKAAGSGSGSASPLLGKRKREASTKGINLLAAAALGENPRSAKRARTKKDL